jgi:hypothetical protein
MLTQAAPAIVQALAGVLPDAALKQLVQALGNCVQPLTHRGQVNVQPDSGKLPGGFEPSGGRWNPNDYQGIMPRAGGGGFTDFPGYSQNWNTNNYAGSQFSFPTNAEFNTNNYYGGPTFNVGGNSYFENSYVTNHTTENLTTNNFNVRYINNFPVEPGPAGPPGDKGDRGNDGAPGADGGGGFDPRTKADAFLDSLPAIGPAEGLVVIPGDAIHFNAETCTVTVDPFQITLPVKAGQPQLRAIRYYGP